MKNPWYSYRFPWCVERSRVDWCLLGTSEVMLTGGPTSAIHFTLWKLLHRLEEEWKWKCLWMKGHWDERRRTHVPLPCEWNRKRLSRSWGMRTNRRRGSGARSENLLSKANTTECHKQDTIQAFAMRDSFVGHRQWEECSAVSGAIR